MNNQLSEARIQSEVFQYVWGHEILPRYSFWHVPNGELRGKIQGAKLKSMGVVPGVFDIHVFYREQFYIIEFKASEKEGLSDNQRAFEAVMLAHGAKSFTVWDVEQGIELFKKIRDGLL